METRWNRSVSDVKKETGGEDSLALFRRRANARTRVTPFDGVTIEGGKARDGSTGATGVVCETFDTRACVPQLAAIFTPIR